MKKKARPHSGQGALFDDIEQSVAVNGDGEKRPLLQDLELQKRGKRLLIGDPVQKWKAREIKKRQALLAERLDEWIERIYRDNEERRKIQVRPDSSRPDPQAPGARRPDAPWREPEG